MKLTDTELDEIRRRDNVIGPAAADRRKLLAHIDGLNAQIADYVEQANSGIWAEHKCPAYFACAYIVADGEGL